MDDGYEYEYGYIFIGVKHEQKKGGLFVPS